MQGRQLHVQTVNGLRWDRVHAHLNHLSSFTFIEVFAVANSNDMVSTAEKTRACTDYHQRCWGAVENVLVWDYASSSVTLWKKVQTSSSRFICLNACYHLKSVNQRNTKRVQCIGLWNLQEWIALWTFSVVRVQLFNQINTNCI